jgi:hypothetical protein
MQELVYHLGSFLASREKLWGLLKFHGVPRNILMFVASVLDFKLGTEWSHIVKSIELLQRTHSENVSTLLKNLSREVIVPHAPILREKTELISMQARLLRAAQKLPAQVIGGGTNYVRFSLPYIVRSLDAEVVRPVTPLLDFDQAITPGRRCSA